MFREGTMSLILKNPRDYFSGFKFNLPNNCFWVYFNAGIKSKVLLTK